MARPKWSDAPSWARWVAMDASGLWVWYEVKPYIFDDKSTGWFDQEGTKFHVSANFGGGEPWRQSLCRLCKP